MSVFTVEDSPKLLPELNRYETIDDRVHHAVHQVAPDEQEMDCIITRIPARTKIRYQFKIPNQISILFKGSLCTIVQLKAPKPIKVAYNAFKPNSTT